MLLGRQRRLEQAVLAENVRKRRRPGVEAQRLGGLFISEKTLPLASDRLTERRGNDRIAAAERSRGIKLSQRHASLLGVHLGGQSRQPCALTYHRAKSILHRQFDRRIEPVVKLLGLLNQDGGGCKLVVGHGR